MPSDEHWQGYKNANFVKGNHKTELDKETLRYYKDIARPRDSIQDIMKDMCEKIMVKANDGSMKNLKWKWLRFDKPTSECILPYID